MASIAVGASLKERLAAYLRQHSYQVRDYGDGLDYPDVVAEGAQAEHDRALLVCAIGLGMGHRRQQGPRRPRPATEPISSPLTVSSNLRRRRLARRLAADPW